jgi:hypothetical protein
MWQEKKKELAAKAEEQARMARELLGVDGLAAKVADASLADGDGVKEAAGPPGAEATPASTAATSDSAAAAGGGDRTAEEAEATRRKDVA